MNALFSIQAYGVLGYSMTFALALGCASVGIAYFRAGRDRLKAALFVLTSFCYALLFGYLVLVSMELTWLNRSIMQPSMRTVALVGAVSGWGYLYLLLRREAALNGPHRQPSRSNTEHSFQGEGE